jgi:hypothetical protein
MKWHYTRVCCKRVPMVALQKCEHFFGVGFPFKHVGSGIVGT